MAVKLSAPLYLARHAETIFNAGRRMQGQHRHTPLTHQGIAQAHAMGTALRAHFGVRPDLAFWASTAGRTQQTASIIAEHLELDFFDVQLDDRLQEIHVGLWEDRPYADVLAEQGEILDRERGLFSVPPPAGEWYPAIADRMTSWLHTMAAETRPILAISHGIASRVLRGVLIGGQAYGREATPIAKAWPQGTIVCIKNGAETAVHLGSGAGPVGGL